MKKTSYPIKIRDITYIAFCATLIIVCAWIKLPFVIPITMQSFAIFLTAGLLGGKRATISVLLYILLGAIGLPVFSGFTGGIGILSSATGGYIFGFMLLPLCKWISEKHKPRSTIAFTVSQAIGLLFCYTTGTLWYVYMFSDSTSATIASTLGICVTPFILPDICKLALAIFITNRLKKHIK